ncbi:EAL domain-containing protein [Pseudosporangium ferrugineum]|uniref:Diguanylate cyclase (GGDEF)-like protein n=1 Tax=Pseudosporangium ferrugineum TaxID=439699 RepID=A0A2T0RHK1_9ACTN|nr:EAL domain-containing protein [Pseudosporangium ferrugineum]PRY20611.1 diguanylate cyclase (GGDEF)-like protein [Pseudosporangium ferrugineum]
MSKAETINVGVLSTAFGGPYFGELMAGMARELTIAGGKMIAIQTVDAGTIEQDFPEPPPFPHHVAWDHVGGFVVVLNGVSTDYLRAARDSGRPVVVISNVPAGFDCPVVVPDNFAGTRAAIQHLIDHGHTRVGFVGFPGNTDVHERIQAYQKTMADNGLAADPELLFVVDDMQEASGERAARMMLERGMPATAVLAGNDRNAIGLIQALTNAGIDLPDRLAVIGFDDNEAGASMIPSLTSVRQPLEDIGARAVRLLIRMRGGEEVPSGKHVLPTALTVRESCGCAGVVRTAIKAFGAADIAGIAPDSASSLLALLESQPAGIRYLTHGGDVGGSAAAIDDALRCALAGTGRPGDRDLRPSLVPLAEMLQDGEGLAAVVRVIRRHAWQLQSGAGLDKDFDVTRRMEVCLQEIFLLLAQAQVIQLSVHTKSMMSSLSTQYSVSLQLLRSQEKDPRSLGWLQVTDVRAGCLGLWPEQEPVSGERASLTVVGRFDREDGGTGSPHELVPITAFPPAELVSLADVAADHMVYIAHLKVGTGDWGMLAVVARIQAYVREGRETMNQWAALLSVALEHEALLKMMREQEEHLRRAALYDELTGLPNRAYFRTRLTAAMARANRRSDYRYAVLMLDLDGFKIVNDSLGHHAGDQLLQQVATRLTTTLRSVDTAARFGGDEFAILLEEIDDNTPVTVAERLQRDLSQPHRLGDTEVVVSASIGITVGGTEYDDTEAIVRDADVAMYQAKTHGKRSHAIFDPVMHRAATDRLTIEGDLRKALQHRQLVLFYQPIVDLRTLTVIGAEALIRWRHPTRGLVPPNEFLGVAEESGLSLGIGTWVLDGSCRQMHRWGLHRGDARPFRMSINVSNRQFWQSTLIEDVDETLRVYGLSPDRLAVEITEGVIMDDVKVASSMLSGLRTLGVQVHIDDFGTGFSSLEALHDLTIDAFKVDRSFISRITTSSRGKELVRTIVTMGLNLNLDVIAEGIETDEQLDFVRGLGCPHGQGYLFSRAVPADEFAKLLAPGVAIPGAIDRPDEQASG